MRLEIRVPIPPYTGTTRLYSYSKILHDTCSQLLKNLHKGSKVSRIEKYAHVGQYSEGFDEIRGHYIYRFYIIVNGKDLTKVVWIDGTS